MNHGIIALVDDMIFVAKIRGTAESVGVIVHFVRSISSAIELAALEPRSLVLVDLNARCCDGFELAKQIKSDEHLTRISLVGFFSHVQTEIQRQAEEAGFDRILPRSSFTKNLPQILDGSFLKATPNRDR